LENYAVTLEYPDDTTEVWAQWNSGHTLTVSFISGRVVGGATGLTGVKSTVRSLTEALGLTGSNEAGSMNGRLVGGSTDSTGVVASTVASSPAGNAGSLLGGVAATTDFSTRGTGLGSLIKRDSD
ncbi:hypothetical protein V5O48_007925, partial [Marasmius crinis-equi]